MGIVDKLKQRYRSSYLIILADILAISSIYLHFVFGYFTERSDLAHFVQVSFTSVTAVLFQCLSNYRDGIKAKPFLSRYPNLKRSILFLLVAFALVRPAFTDSLLLYGFGAELIPLLILIVANEVTIITDRKVKSAGAS